MNISKFSVVFENGTAAEFHGEPTIQASDLPEMITKFEESIAAMEGQAAPAPIEVIQPADVGSRPDAPAEEAATPEVPVDALAPAAPQEPAPGNNVAFVIQQEDIDANPILAEKGFTAGQQVEAVNVPQGESPFATFLASLQ